MDTPVTARLLTSLPETCTVTVSALPVRQPETPEMTVKCPADFGGRQFSRTCSAGSVYHELLLMSVSEPPREILRSVTGYTKHISELCSFLQLDFSTANICLSARKIKICESVADITDLDFCLSCINMNKHE